MVEIYFSNFNINNMIGKKIIMLFVVAFLGISTLVAKELRTVIFKVEQMHCMNCEKKIKENIRFEKGLKKLETDLEEKTVTITYDADKTSIDKIKEGFRKIKYEVEVIEDKKLSNK